MHAWVGTVIYLSFTGSVGV
ncbi:hypothetical protein MXB_2720 [Myxobolus squamalis]|nr:hypothetical protein MXB_2720 [Myxobolus squamalis]